MGQQCVPELSLWPDISTVSGCWRVQLRLRLAYFNGISGCLKPIWNHQRLLWWPLFILPAMPIPPLSCPDLLATNPFHTHKDQHVKIKPRQQLSPYVWIGMRTLMAVPGYLVAMLTCVIGTFTIQEFQIGVTKPPSVPTERRASNETSCHNSYCVQ